MQEHTNRLVSAAILSVFVCSTLAWLLLGMPSSGINDADIFLVYARNFMAGHGLVYHIASEPIEGIPSLLWMLLCSLVFIVSYTAEIPLFLLNLLFGILTVYICLKRCNQKPAFLLLLCATPAWFAWCQVALVESGLWCLLLTASILAVSERNISRCTWLLPLLALTRPESMLWGCWLILVLFLGLAQDRSWRTGLRAAFRPVFTFGITWAGLMSFRGVYFGSLFPSSSCTTPNHGLQINMGGGILSLLGYLFSSPPVLLVVTVFGWVCVREIRRNRELTRVSAVCMCLLPGLVIPLMAGDEPFRAFRYYQPVWPLLCMVAAWAMPLLYERQRTWIRRLAPAALLLTGWGLFAISPHLKHEFQMARSGRDQGAVLARMFEDHESLPSVGIMAAGGCSYSYPGAVYDLKGLALAKREQDKNLARSDREVMNEWFPDILIRSVSGAADRQLFRQLRSDPQFRKHYIKGELWYNDEIFPAYYSRGFLNRLEEGHYAFSRDLEYELSMEHTQGPPDLHSDGVLVSDFYLHDPDAPALDVPSLWSPPQKL